MKKCSIFTFFLLFTTLIANAQKINKFGADLGMKTVLGKEIRVPSDREKTIKHQKIIL